MCSCVLWAFVKNCERGNLFWFMEHHYTRDLSLIILENNHGALRLRSFSERIPELEIGFVVGSCYVEDLISQFFCSRVWCLNSNSVHGSSWEEPTPESWSKMIFKVSYNPKHSMMKNSGEISLSNIQECRQSLGLQRSAWEYNLLLVVCPHGSCSARGWIFGKNDAGRCSQGQWADGRDSLQHLK